ncbi:hypothetical protein [Ponticaulis sp.]|uniref:hypothetical protein n=1 Tax=Ponticaulis sp. TaxID=2020902 RepID=UPI000B71E197|nr:hypothetical protein [Ponticaulis sp.]OUX99690.1 MAG: hypothetical protein CBB65_06280 [Hyphomonadaceae bacterium TMED5]|tara:strand:- start:33659 stop:34678 length:1020 start_codon:yes stop_codon:yes gene_type:complete
MHEAPASLPDMNSPSVMAGRLRRHLGGVEAYANGSLEFEDEAPRPTDKPRHMQRRYYETLLTHIRRAEYQLRCFILWLAAILIEKAQANPEFMNALIGTSQVNSLEGGLCNPNGLPDQTQNEPNSFAWKQELELRSLTVATPHIGGFNVTTPVFKTARGHSGAARIKAFRPDPLSLVDASYLVARMARLPRILARADQMAERLARRAVLSAFYRESRAEAENNKNSAVNALYREGAVNNRHPLSGERDWGEGLLTLSVAQARAGPPNPLWFQPLQHWLPPEELWASSEDEDERADLNWLHLMAVSALTRAGFAPGEAPTAHLPDLSRFEPPSPPIIRTP